MSSEMAARTVGAARNSMTPSRPGKHPLVRIILLCVNIRQGIRGDGAGKGLLRDQLHPVVFADDVFLSGRRRGNLHAGAEFFKVRWRPLVRDHPAPKRGGQRGRCHGWVGGCKLSGRPRRGAIDGSRRRVRFRRGDRCRGFPGSGCWLNCWLGRLPCFGASSAENHGHRKPRHTTNHYNIVHRNGTSGNRVF